MLRSTGPDGGGGSRLGIDRPGSPAGEEQQGRRAAAERRAEPGPATRLTRAPEMEEM